MSVCLACRGDLPRTPLSVSGLALTVPCRARARASSPITRTARDGQTAGPDSAAYVLSVLSGKHGPLTPVPAPPLGLETG